MRISCDNYYAKLATFCWYRARRATNPVWRSRWFHGFDVFIELSHVNTMDEATAWIDKHSPH